MKKEILKWRLGKLPSPDEVRELVKDKIITQNEAREILFSNETIEERDADSLKAEIKFLRSLVEKLSENKNQIITTVKEIQVPYQKWDWYKPYTVWCENATVTSGNTFTTNSTGTALLNAVNTAFSKIQTF